MGFLDLISDEVEEEDANVEELMKNLLTYDPLEVITESPAEDDDAVPNRVSDQVETQDETEEGDMPLVSTPVDEFGLSERGEEAQEQTGENANHISATKCIVETPQSQRHPEECEETACLLTGDQDTDQVVTRVEQSVADTSITALATQKRNQTSTTKSLQEPKVEGLGENTIAEYEYKLAKLQKDKNDTEDRLKSELRAAELALQSKKQCVGCIIQ